MSTAVSLAEEAACSLQRVYVACDSRLKALFSDNTILVLPSAAGAFTHICPNGVSTSQLVDYCVRRYTKAVVEVLQFRNLHLDHPRYCKCLLQSLKPTEQFVLGYPIRDLCWPRSTKDAYDRGLVEQLDCGKTAVKSQCSSARIVLDGHRLRFAVCYPLLLQQEGQQYHYVWQTQVFSTRNYPDRWRPALLIAFELADLLTHSSDGPCSPHKATQSLLSPVGRHCQSVHAPSLTAISSTTQLPVSGSNTDGSTVAACLAETAAAGPWWTQPSCSLPTDELLSIQWTPEATFLFIQVGLRL